MHAAIDTSRHTIASPDRWLDRIHRWGEVHRTRRVSLMLGLVACGVIATAGTSAWPRAIDRRAPGHWALEAAGPRDAWRSEPRVPLSRWMWAAESGDGFSRFVCKANRRAASKRAVTSHSGVVDPDDVCAFREVSRPKGQFLCGGTCGEVERDESDWARTQREKVSPDMSNSRRLDRRSSDSETAGGARRREPAQKRWPEARLAWP
jgi:hypothetical protein